MNKLKLQKLIDIVIEFAEMNGNEWMKTKLLERFGVKTSANAISAPKIEEIYEYCLRKIVREHAEQFYKDFKLLDIKDKLIEDFIRMEKFRREDNFEDFCLAAYQQLEYTVNRLVLSPEFLDYFKLQKDTPAFMRFNMATMSLERAGKKTIGSLIFSTNDSVKIANYLEEPLSNWYFNHKLRAVIYYYYFNCEIKSNSDLFDKVYDSGNYLYQGRNLNHRGTFQSEYNKGIVNEMMPNKHKYYFIFLGFLGDFIANVNNNI